MRWIATVALGLLACRGPEWHPVLEPQGSGEGLAERPAPPVLSLGGPPGKSPCKPLGGGEPLEWRVGVVDRWARLNAPPLSTPSVGRAFMDPVFKTRVERLTEQSKRGPMHYEVQLYSQLRATSADNAFLLSSTDAGFRVRCLADGREVSLDLSEVNVPRWHPTLSHLLIHFDRNDDQVVEIRATDVTNGQRTVVARLDGYVRVRVNQSFDELSHDGKWLAGVATTKDGKDEIFSFDLEHKKVAARLPLSAMFGKSCELPDEWDAAKGTPLPDWVAPSPLGDLLVVQWAHSGQSRCRGLETYDIESGAFVGRVHRDHPHGDLGVVPEWWTKPKDQRQFFMTFEQNLGPVVLALGYRFLPGSTDSTSTPNILLPLAPGNAGHVSCQGPDGFCLVSTGPGSASGTAEDPTSGWQPYENELFIAGLDRSIRRVAHHRSSECGYWAQPRATWSRDGRFVVFSSDWGLEQCKKTPDKTGNADVYVVDLAAAP